MIRSTMILKTNPITFKTCTALIVLILGSCNNPKQSEQGVAIEEKKAIPTYLKQYEELYHEDPREANLAWFKEAKLGLFMHYGLYSLLGEGEWVQLTHDPPIPVSDYDTLKDDFTAEDFDADFITNLALEAGMKYINITTRHHDGFCLFKTEQTDFNSLHAPANRDLVKELYESCEKRGLGLFLYYSYAADWRHPYFYPREEGWENARPDYAEPQPEYRFQQDEDFEQYIDFVHGQLRELLTQYPNVAGIWLDPIMGYYHRPDLFPVEETYALIRSLSPHALISFKQGANGEEDFSAPERSGSAAVGEQFEVARTVYEKNNNKPKEVCNTLQPKLKGMHGGSTWGYNASLDGKHLQASQVMDLIWEADSLGYNLLLNVGPRANGSFPEEDIQTLKEVGKRVKKDKSERIN